MHDFLKIPGNEAAFTRLLELLRSGDAVAFVGAGASAPLYPLWEALLDELIGEVEAQGRVAEPRLRKWRQQGKTKPLDVASRIRRALGDSRFFDALSTRFAPIETGDSYTATHAALAALPFRGYVTTNYDIGLTQALSQRETFATPATWRGTEVARWLRREHPGGGRPVLHAHGVYSDADSLVLDRGRYGEAYESEAFRALLDELWRGGRLVTVGFSFSDPWLDLHADQAIRRSAQRGAVAPGHVAIVGVTDRSDVEDLRSDVETIYHGNVLIYDIVDGSHAALGDLLDAVRHDLDESAVATDPATGPSALDRWLDLVAEEHEVFADGFTRRREALKFIKTAWVRLELSRSIPDRADLEALAEGGPREGSAPGCSTLDTYLDLDRSSPENRWVTGRWLVEGDPGSGKTTLLRYLAARRAEATRAGEGDDVPLFLPLPKLTEPLRMPLAFVRDEVGDACGGGLAEVLDAAGRDGRLLVLLDALDEVPPERRDRVGKVLSWLAAEWPRATVVMSSRPIGRGAVPDDFVKLDLQALDPAQRLEFLAKWFDSEAVATVAAKHFDRDESLHKLSLNPLHLTLLAVLWEQGIEAPRRRSELYDEILAMLLAGKHREKAKAMEPTVATREILRGLAWAHTVDDLPSEAPERLADRLLDEDLVTWRDRVRREWSSDVDFLDAVAERTFILGPHDGRGSPWRFWHRTLREALTAERLDQVRKTGGEEAILERVEALADEDEGRWAEPFALLAGRAGSDRLIVELTRRRPSLGVRALETAQGLSAVTLAEMLDALDDRGNLHPEQRGAVYEAIPAHLADADAALDLIDHLRREARNGNDLFFLDLARRLTAERWPDAADRADELRDRFFDHLPAPPAELFRRFTTPKGEAKDLWCPIPTGVYPIGSDDHDDDEKPRHRVEIVESYQVAAVPVTNAHYAAFDPARAPRGWDGVPDEHLPDHPRVDVTWWEAMSFCRWLAAHGFDGARLPSEEEWEVACRANSETDYWHGDGEEALDPIGWYSANSKERTHRVGGKRPNRWGLYDVHGNVWEWTCTPWNAERYKDRSTETPFSVDPSAEPDDLAGPPSAWRVFRGGSYAYSAGWARSAFRNAWIPGNRWRLRGFRVVLPLPPADGRS